MRRNSPFLNPPFCPMSADVRHSVSWVLSWRRSPDRRSVGTAQSKVRGSLVRLWAPSSSL